MTSTEIINIRMINQHISGTRLKSVKEIVGWMGAIQAQDFNMAKWAIGIRFPGSTEKVVDEAINKGEILRTHILRPTWHFVSADDIYWMLELTAPYIRARLKSRHKYLGFTENIIRKGNRIIEKALSGGKHLTREELMAELKKAELNISDNRSSHFMIMAELSGLVCSGASKGNKPTYALFEKRVTARKSLKKDEALALLAVKYFTSHGPATIGDFIWWSGLPALVAKKALLLIKNDLISEKINSKEYWFSPAFSVFTKKSQSVILLPAFDEYFISYKDRSAVLNGKKSTLVISQNGFFNPQIIQNGIVTGIWKKTDNKNDVIIKTEFFKKPDKTTSLKLKKESVRFGKFFNKKSDLIIN